MQKMQKKTHGRGVYMDEWKCFLCGSRVIWGCDFMFEDYGMDGDGIVHTYTCSNCGAAYEVYESFEGEEQ